MTRTRALVLAAGIAAAIPAQAQHAHKPGDAVIPIGEGCGKGMVAARSLDRGRGPVEDPSGWAMACDADLLTDLLHCDLDIELIPSTTTITGSNTFTLMSMTDGLTAFTFRLRSQYAITSAVVNGSTAVSVSNPTTTTRIATLDRAYNTGEVFTLKISYTGVPMSIGSFGSVSFDTVAGQPLFQTLSEPYYAYTWWPCKDGDVATVGDNSDKFTTTMAITAPQAMASVSNGSLEGIDVLSGNRRRFRWATQYQMTTYIVSICSTVYNQWQQPFAHSGGTMPVEFSIYPGNDTPANRAAWEKCIPMLGTFSGLFGPYPFLNEKYGIYNFNFSGGEEHQTYTGQGGFGESLTAHELAHQWWGNDVTCKTWPDIWLNEGFATYSEALWEQYKPGSTGWPAYFSAMNARKPTNVAGTVYRTDVSSASTIFSSTYAYRKGGWVLHQLRKVVGDAAFFNILATYRAMYTGSAATTDEFAAVCSAVHGSDLTWFFQEWVYGPGAMAFASGWNTAAINGQNYLRLRLRQTQVGTYPVYTMPVDIRVNTAAGSETVTVWTDAGTEWYVVPISAPATGIVVDENNWILTTAKTSEAYVSGPPKIVQASVLPGQTLTTPPAAITVTFSEGVSPATTDFELTGPSGAVPATPSYNASTFTWTLTFIAPLAPGSYSLRIRDTIVSTAAAIRLDGEASGGFPSGDGQPLGDAVWAFTVAGAACYANCDQSTTPPVLNVGDFSCFLNAFASGASYANCDASTVSPVLNVADFSCFLNAFAAGCP